MLDLFRNSLQTKPTICLQTIADFVYKCVLSLKFFSKFPRYSQVFLLLNFIKISRTFYWTQFLSTYILKITANFLSFFKISTASLKFFESSSKFPQCFFAISLDSDNFGNFSPQFFQFPKFLRTVFAKFP